MPVEVRHDSEQTFRPVSAQQARLPPSGWGNISQGTAKCPSNSIWEIPKRERRRRQAGETANCLIYMVISARDHLPEVLICSEGFYCAVLSCDYIDAPD